MDDHLQPCRRCTPCANQFNVVGPPGRVSVQRLHEINSNEQYAEGKQQTEVHKKSSDEQALRRATLELIDVETIGKIRSSGQQDFFPISL